MLDDDLQTPEISKSGVIHYAGRPVPFSDLTISPDENGKSVSKRSSDSEYKSPYDAYDESLQVLLLSRKSRWRRISCAEAVVSTWSSFIALIYFSVCCCPFVSFLFSQNDIVSFSMYYL